MIDAILDLSHWQTVNDFSVVKNTGGISGVILKATQGSRYVDPTFTGRAALAQRAGLLVGAYAFLDGSPIVDQISHFLAVAGYLPKLVLDIEPNSIDGGTVTMMGAATAVSIMHSRTGRLPVIYMNRYGLDSRGTGLPNGTLARCDLWLPSYGSSPKPPAGWSTAMLWQYTDMGSCAGVSGNCDRSRFFGDLAQLTAWWDS